MLKKREIIELILLGLVILAMVIFWEPLIRFSTDVEALRELFLSFGILSSIAFILFTIIQVIIPPIPGQIAGLAGGYVFGIALGTFYSVIGLLIGTYIIIATSRKYGRPFIEKIVKKERLDNFNKKFKKGGLLTLFFLFLIPIFPDDIISYLVGLTKLKMKNLLIVATVARIPKYLAFNIIGSGLYVKNLKLVVSLSVALVVISIVLYIYKDKLNDLISGNKN